MNENYVKSLVFNILIMMYKRLHNLVAWYSSILPHTDTNSQIHNNNSQECKIIFI